MNHSLTLVSHHLCPYVQRAAIVLAEKGVPFERRDIDLAHKPEWFLRISPLGKTPVLLVGEEAIFESAVICEYLDETAAPRLHPDDPLERARHRSWIEFASAILNKIAGFYNAADDETLWARAKEIRLHLEMLEHALGQGPYFKGNSFTIVDAAFGPVFRYFDAFDSLDDFRFCTGLAKLTAWRSALGQRKSVVEAVSPEYPQALRKFLLMRHSSLSVRLR